VLTLPWSTGLVEDKINKLKLINARSTEEPAVTISVFAY
jgi:hypothetical protein